MTYSCGHCGASFDSKGAKRRHKLDCTRTLADPEGSDDYGDEDHFSRVQHVTPEIKARAAAEWEAMDWRGRLPKGWRFTPNLDRVIAGMEDV